MNKNIAQVVVGLPVAGPFDYAVDPAQRAALEVGTRVRVFFNRRKMVGYLVGFCESSKWERLNTIVGPLENGPSLSPGVLRWTQQAAAYYGCSWGELIELIYPAALRRGKFMELGKAQSTPSSAGPGRKRLVTGYQLREAHDHIWLSIVNDNLSAGRGVLIVTPDKFYSAYFTRRLKALTEHQVISFEKKLKVDAQLDQFQAVHSGCPCVIVGTRSSIFAPHGNLGQIIVIHDEHDWHKAEQSPHYRTHKIGLLRSATEGTDISFMSLNPRAELWYESQQEVWDVTQLNKTSDAQVQLIDMDNYRPGKSSILSFPVQNTIRETLDAGGRLLLYFNRKGFMTFTRCQQCGHAIKCPRCDTHLILRHKTQQLSCHGCGHTEPLPAKCPQCAWPYLRSTGMGIEKLEGSVCRFFPEAKTAILDKDSQALPRGANIVLATSAIFKFQSTFQADCVIMLDYDQGMYHVDFRSAHKALTTLLLLQALAKEKLIVQTRLPDDPSLRAAQRPDISSFMDC